MEAIFEKLREVNNRYVKREVKSRGKITEIAQAILKGKIINKILLMANGDDWALARSGCPEKLYGFHRGHWPFLKSLMTMLFQGMI